jgi:hypothetical protein
VCRATAFRKKMLGVSNSRVRELFHELIEGD